MRIKEPDLRTWIICNANGYILVSHCNCMAGLDEVCSHVGALLFFCEYITKQRDGTAVTDKLAYWVNPNSSKKVTLSPKKATKICYRNAQTMYSKPEKIRKEDVFINTKKLPKNPIHNLRQLQVFLNKVKSINPNCVALKVVPPFCTDLSNADPRKKFPFILTKLYAEEHEKKSLDELQRMGSRLKFNLTDEDLLYIEKSSRLQSKVDKWRLFRAGRITGSVAYQVCHVRAPDSNISLIKSISYPSRTQIRKKSILWGCDHEKDALAAYIETMNEKNHSNLQV